MKLLPFLFLAGCALDEPTYSDVEQFVKKEPGGDCPTYGCGTNSPETEGRPFWEQNEIGLANDDGIRLVSFTKAINGYTYDYRLDVYNGQLLARNKTSGAIMLSGVGVLGAVMTFDDTVTNNRYYVTVSNVGMIRMWATPPVGTGIIAYTYDLLYNSDTDSNRRNLCSAAGEPTGDSMNPFSAVLFDDDEIDPEALRVVGERSDWFNIGCAGSALAKLHLAGHTKAGSVLAGRSTTLPARTAFLKMLTADYCGMGDAYTVAKMELHYRDASGYLDTTRSGDAIEAIWGENGALCVNTPRAEYSPNLLSWGLFGSSIDDELADFRCTLPRPCVGRSLTFPRTGAYVLSTNY